MSGLSLLAAPADLAQFATTQEILRQPDIWGKFGPELSRSAAEVRAWCTARAPDEIWFCGAGTSAFIGETLVVFLNRAAGPARFRAIPTTDLVASPLNYIRSGVRPLVVSFGRSGNSSETVGTLNLLARHLPQADRLHITCNSESRLANAPAIGPGELRTLVLPPETDDQGFAMTSSYTTMLLTALACFDPAPQEPIPELFARLADAGAQILNGGFARLAAWPMPERAVFLGAGPLTGAARECALKVLELTAGKVQTSWDSPLGFRHGPKAVVNAATTVFLLQSSNPHTAAYDTDLANEIRSQFGADRLVILGAEARTADVLVPSVGSDAWSAVLYVLVAQMLATLWSSRLGYNVDDPFAGRNLSRVVSGVHLYDLPLPRQHFTGAMDVGGTKVESVLYDSGLQPIARRRMAVRKNTYEDLLATLVEEATWLEQEAGGTLDFGIGLPGLVDPVDGRSLTANLPATGHTLAADLATRAGRRFVIGNDCKCFALSEANGGAGAGFRTVFGLIIGTGIGGGVTVNGKLVAGLNRMAGEVGHLGIPAELASRHGLPLEQCGCGRVGCYETLVAGPGLSRLARHIGGCTAEPAEIARLAGSGDAIMQNVMAVWIDLLAEMIYTIQLTTDADVIVLGGGLSAISDLPDRLAVRFAGQRLAGMRSPHFVVAQFGDASGVRGAAMLARHGEL